MAVGYLLPIGALYQGFSDQGVVGNGFKINTYVGGSVSTPVTTYTDSTLTVQNSNPIILGSNGHFQSVNCWVPAGTAVKLVLTDASNNVITGGTIDNVTGVNDVSLSSSGAVGQALWPQSAGEIAAGITPTNYGYIWGSVMRYGADPTGAASSTTAFLSAAQANTSCTIPAGTYKLTAGTLAFASSPVRFTGAGRNAVTLNCVSGTANLFSWTGSGTGGGLTGVTINGTGMTGGILISFVGQARGWFDDISITGGFNGMLVQDQNVCEIGSVWMNGLTGTYGFKYFGGGTGAAQVLNIKKLIIGFTTNIITSPIGVLIDGDADTMNADAIGVTKGGNGMVIQNSGNLANGAAFLTVNTFQSDFSYSDGLVISGGTAGSPSVTSVTINSCYCQGSVAGKGVNINQYARNVFINAEQITGNFQQGIFSDGRYVKIVSPQVAHNSVAGSAIWGGIELGANSLGTSINGGLAGQWVGYASELQSYGIIVDAGAQAYEIIGVNCLNNVTGAILDNANDANSTILACAGSSINRIAKKGIALTFESSGIPMILPSSGTIGNNGALSALTALPTTYTSCYMAFPANAIFAGSAFGLYYVVMSSTTAGTIFNNVYTNGEPSIPASPTPFVSTGPGAFTQTTGSPILLRNSTILANSLGPNGTIEISTLWSMNSTAGTKTANLAYSTANIMTLAVTTSTNINAPTQIIQNRGATNKQVAAPAILAAGASSSPAVYTTIDSTAAQTLQASAQLSVATDFLILERMTTRISFSL